MSISPRQVALFGIGGATPPRLFLGMLLRVPMLLWRKVA